MRASLIQRIGFVASFASCVIVGGCKTSDFAGEGKKDAEAPPMESKSFQQNALEPRSVVVKQGTTGASSNESYNVTSKGVLDLLIVVDTSGSMAEEQQNLSSRLTPLLSAVKDSDWQIAVTTTDTSDRCVTSLLQKGDYFVETRFKSAINAGTDGAGLERPIYRAVEGLKSQCLFGPGKWVRPNSTLAVLIITDEDNCHIDIANGYGCSGQSDKEGKYLTDYLSSIRKIGTEARVYGLFWHPSQAKSQCSTALKSANIVADVVTATSGTWGSICDSDYSATLSKISSDVAQILKADFSLKSIPDPGTFKMTVGGKAWTDYTLTGTLVHFTVNPPQGAAIAVTYVSGAAGIVTNQFDLPSTPADGSVTATIGSATTPVSWDASKRKAVFTTTPPNGSSITISYKEAGTLKDAFVIASGVDASTLKVVVNGKAAAASEYSYDAGTGAVKFKVPPPASAKVDISWRGAKKLG